MPLLSRVRMTLLLPDFSCVEAKEQDAQYLLAKLDFAVKSAASEGDMVAAVNKCKLSVIGRDEAYVTFTFRSSTICRLLNHVAGKYVRALTVRSAEC